MSISTIKAPALIISSILAFGMATAAYALDPSLPYRNQQGFQCFYWNAQGECLSFSYYPGGTPIYDTYPTYTPSYTPTYTTPVYTPTYTAPIYTPTYAQPYISTPYYASNRLSITVSGSPKEVEDGDTINYSIYLRNDMTVSRKIDVRAFLDQDTTFVSASANGDEVRNDDEVEWTDVSVPARSSKTLTLKVRVASRVRDGDTLTLRVEADGQSDEEDTDVVLGSNSGNCYYYDSYGTRRYDSSCNNYRNSSSCYYYDRYGNRVYDSSCNDYNSSSDCYYYDSNGTRRYDSYCDNYGSNTQDVRVRITGAYPDPVEPGATLTWTIRVDNDGDRTAVTDVIADLDRNLDYLSSSDSGDDVSSSRVRWSRVTIDRYSSKTFTLQTSVNRDLSQGRDITLDVSAGNDDDSRTVTTDYRRRY